MPTWLKNLIYIAVVTGVIAGTIVATPHLTKLGSYVPLSLLPFLSPDKAFSYVREADTPVLRNNFYA